MNVQTRATDDNFALAECCNSVDGLGLAKHKEKFASLHIPNSHVELAHSSEEVVAQRDKQLDVFIYPTKGRFLRAAYQVNSASVHP